MTGLEQWCLERGLTAPWVVTIVAALPVLELRGAIPLGIFGFRLQPWFVFGLSLLGNLAVIPVLVWLVEPVYRWLRRFRWLHRTLDRCEQHARKRAGLVERFELLGLMLFVSVPLPGTGAWTGAFVASLFRFKRLHACLAIGAGVMIAGVAILIGAVGLDQLLHGQTP